MRFFTYIVLTGYIAKRDISIAYSMIILIFSSIFIFIVTDVIKCSYNGKLYEIGSTKKTFRIIIDVMIILLIIADIVLWSLIFYYIETDYLVYWNM